MSIVPSLTEGFDDFRFDGGFIPGLITISFVQDGAVFGNQHAEGGGAFGVIQRYGTGLFIEQHGKGQLMALAIGSYFGNRIRTVHRNAQQHETFAFMPSIDLVEMGHRRETRFAPCRPKVEHDHVVSHIIG